MLQFFSSQVFEKIKSYNEDMGKYGYEDSLINIRMFKLKFISLFETKTKIYHIDPGGETDYLKWKHQQAKDNYEKYKKIFDDYVCDKRSVCI